MFKLKNIRWMLDVLELVLTRCLPPYMPTELPRQATESLFEIKFTNSLCCLSRSTMSFVGLIPWNFILGTPPPSPPFPSLSLPLAKVGDIPTPTLCNALVRACKRCYNNDRQSMGRWKARETVKRSFTYCPSCPDQPQLCDECFKIVHQK